MEVIAVTGATSMIGSALIRSCLRHGVSKIYAIVRPGSVKRDRLPDDAAIIPVECAVDNYGMLPQLIPEPCDVFYHMAWSLTGPRRNDDLTEQANNIQYTLEAVAAAHALGCRKFVGSGSQAEYGKLDVEKIGPDTPVDPIQPYGIAKYAAGKLAMEAARKAGMSCLWVRVFSVYGIFDKPTTMIASAVRKMLEGEKTGFTAGEQIWDYLFSEDAGDAFYLIGEKAEGCRVYCLGSGEARTIRSYIEEMGEEIHPVHPLGVGEMPYAPGTVMHLCADIETLRRDTGFAPQTDFREGIRRTIQWMRGEQNA